MNDQLLVVVDFLGLKSEHRRLPYAEIDVVIDSNLEGVNFLQSRENGHLISEEELNPDKDSDFPSFAILNLG